jgi:translocation and assembly module TamA
LVLALAGAAHAGDVPASDPAVGGGQRGDEANEQAIAYEVTLTGVSGELETAIRQTANLFAFQARPPASVEALRRRAGGDRPLIDDTLRAEGYYDGVVEIALDDAVRPVKVSVAITPGPQYRLGRFDLQLASAADGSPEVPLSELGVGVGKPARAADILDAQDRLVTAMARRAHPLTQVVNSSIVIDHATQEMTVALTVDPGAPATFGPVTITGLTEVDEAFVRNRLPFHQGEPFDLSRLEQARRQLVKTNLFSSIRLVPDQTLNARGELPVTVALQESPHRTIGGTVSWSTNEGPGFEALWEHRNLLAGGETLRLRGYYNFLGFGTEAGFRWPDRFAPDWDLISSLKLARETTQAYESSSATASVGADLTLNRVWKLTGSVAYEYLREDAGRGLRAYELVSLPMKATRDSRDDRLDPAEGTLLTLQFEPYYDAGGLAGPFVRAMVSERGYARVWRDPDITLAGWVDLGSIIGRGVADLPAEKRLYAGGGGSIRGFGYQMAGPVDSAGDPSGGRSLLAFGAEARIKVTDTIGIVPFLEAGTVTASSYPDFSERLFIGAGLGLRYHTPVGPIRADIAVPLNRRNGIDDAFQVYLSLGQAF